MSAFVRTRTLRNTEGSGDPIAPNGERDPVVAEGVRGSGRVSVLAVLFPPSEMSGGSSA